MKSILFLIFLCTTLVTGQTAFSDSTQPVSADSVKINRSLKPITLNDLKFYFSGDVDSSKAVTFEEIPFLGYQGLADLLRTAPQVQVFDFLEMGLPRFVAPLHLWPRQARILKDGFLLNDPTHGMFSTRLVFPDALAWMIPRVQQSQLVSDSNGDLLLRSRSILNDQPYTRIMYREGDFSYTDLDITFATQINPKTMLQLGGLNRDYALTYYRASHYRGQLTRLLSRNLLLQLFYHKASENVNVPDYFGQQYGRFRYNEVREQIQARIFALNAQQKARWQVDAGFQNSRRKYRFSEDGQLVRLRFDRYSVQGRRPFRLFNKSMELAVNASQVKAWGTPYSRKYTDSEGKLSWKSFWPLGAKLGAQTTLSIANRWGQRSQLNSMLSVHYAPALFSLHYTFESYTRFPTMDERFFHFRGLQGQRTILPEHHLNSTFSLNLQPKPWVIMELNLTSHRVNDEIVFDGQHFYNGAHRDFNYLSGQSKLKFFKFRLTVGGQSALKGRLIGAAYSAFVHLRYSDWWFHKRILIRGSTTVQWLGPAKKIAYQPYAESFYLNGGQWPNRLLLYYKISAKIKDAILFMEMDNVLGEQYQIIVGYPELYRRVRFGLSWVLWD